MCRLKRQKQKNAPPKKDSRNNPPPPPEEANRSSRSAPEVHPLALDDEVALARGLVEDGEELRGVDVEVAHGLVRADVVLR